MAFDADTLAEILGRPVERMVPVRGGDVAESYQATLADGTAVFAKTHSRAPEGFFTTESRGLEWLRDAHCVAVPEVLAVSDDPPALVLEWVEPGRPTPDTEADFGRALAALHLAGAPSFGREDGRTTGSRRLPNTPTERWADFYAQNRLLPLARLARDDRALPAASITRIESVAARLPELGPPDDEPPSRLHGDLWAGNRLIGAGGVSWLIDPAAHGGHREFDVSMMLLFGGFGQDCYDAYHDAAPLADGWRARVPLHQLAPLIVHAIKFGGSYVDATADALGRLG